MEKFIEILGNLNDPERQVDEFEIFNDLLTLIAKDKEIQESFEWNSEVVAFSLLSSFQNGTQTYYCSVNPDFNMAKDINPDMIKYWKKRVEDVGNIVIKSGYSDLVWDLSKIATGKSADIKYAYNVIDLCPEIVERKLLKTTCYITRKLERALSVAISIKDNDRIQKIAEVMLDFEKAIDPNKEPGMVGFSFKPLMETKGAIIKDEIKAKVVSDHERRLNHFLENGNPYTAKDISLELASHYNRKGLKEDVKRVLNLIEEALETTGKQPRPSESEGWLSELQSLYQSYGLKIDVERISKKLTELYPEVLKEMKPIRVEIPVSSEKIDSLLDKIVTDNFKETMDRIAKNFIPNKADVQEDVQLNAKTDPLFFMITKKIHDQTGRLVGTVGSIDDDLDNVIVRELAQNLSFSAALLRMCLQRAEEKNYLTDLNRIMEHILSSAALHENRVGVIREGIRAYLDQNFLISIHLLIPQIEAALRNILEKAGGVVIQPLKSGGHPVKLLGNLLQDPTLEDVLGEDLCFYFKVLLTCPQGGWNIRNKVCHGMVDSHSFHVAIADRIFHCFLVLALISDVEQEEPVSRQA